MTKCTHKQLMTACISSPENGQFSRNIFYYMPRVGEWKDLTDNPLSPIPANHSIILCKNGCKIGKTGCFLLFSTVL